MEATKIQSIKELLASNRKILIVTHHNPDGDAIGSSLGLYHYLKQIPDCKINVLVPNDHPQFLAWMSGNEAITIFERNRESGKKLLNEAEVVFCLDFNSFNRVGSFSDDLAASGAVKIMIDHHPFPETYFDYIFSNTLTSSTAELVYDFIVSMGGKDKITRELAECLYTGIITDTGSFSYLCNYEKTYLVVAHLIRTGIDGEKIHGYVYDTFSEERLRLLGYSLSERLVVISEYHTAYIYLSKADFKRFKFQVGDTEGLVNYPLSIKGIRFSALFREQDNKVRMSLRSKGNFSVNEFAREHFSGGGHTNAAGGDSLVGLKETLGKFESLLPQYKDQLERNYE